MKKSSIIIFFSCILPFCSVFAQTEVHIVGPNLNTPAMIVAQETMAEIYKHAGLKFIFTGLPGKRALMKSNQGKYDGELMRGIVIEKIAPNLIRIPISVGMIKISAFTKNKEITIKGWDSLSPYRIGLVRGIEMPEKMTIGLKRSIVDTDVSLFKMLYLGRIDVAVHLEFDSLTVLKKENLHNTIKLLSPPLLEMKLYHYIHKKNPALIDQLTKGLTRLEKRGELYKILKKVQDKVLENF